MMDHYSSSFDTCPPDVVMFDRFGCICLIIYHGINK